MTVELPETRPPATGVDAVEMNDIDRGAGIALWRQIEDALKREITGGDYGPGDRLPTEFALAERFGVNRHTVRRAVAALAERGLVKVDQGRGTFVMEDVVDYAVRKRTRFSENIQGQNRAAGGELIHTAELPADGAMARHLGLPRGARVVMLRTLGRADGRPVNLADHYFDAERFPGLAEAYEVTRSITGALTRFGVADFVRRVTRVTARMPSRDEADMLRQPPTRPLLVTESVNVDGDGRAVEYGIARFAGDRVQLVFEP